MAAQLLRTLAFLLVSFLLVGCGGYEKEDIQTALTEQQLSEIERENRQYLYENADWNVRVEQAQKARKRYFKLKKLYPNAALNAYIEYHNWFHYGHPFAKEVAMLSARMDMAGQGHLPNMIKLSELELQIAKDNKQPKEHGDNPFEFIIEYEIQEEVEGG